MWTDALENVLASGTAHDSDKGVTQHLYGHCMRLRAGEQRTLLCNPRRAISPHYAAAETLWYMGGMSGVDWLCRYAPQYSRFADPDGTAYGAYGPRVVPQLGQALSLLSADSETRQCVVAVWRPDDLQMAGKTPDMPCTLYWQFVISNDKLHMLVTMRSNDLWLGTPYDVFAFTCFQRLMADELSIDVGDYYHYVGDLHVYERNWQAASEAADVKMESHAHSWATPAGVDWAEAVSDAVEGVDDRAHLIEHDDTLGCMLYDLSIACGNQSRAQCDRLGYVSGAFNYVERNYANRRGS